MGLEIIIILILVGMIARQEMIRMALSDKLKTLNDDLTAQTTLIGQVKDKVVNSSEATKQLADAEAAVDQAQTTTTSNTSALNDIIAQ